MALVKRFHDPLLLPGAKLDPLGCLARAAPLEGTAGQLYVERRGIPLAVAAAAGVRFDPDFTGRPAVLIGLRDRAGTLTAVHARYLHNLRGQDKMLTVGRAGGAISVLEGARQGALVLVEGLFDARSLAACGQAAVATIGRDVPWLADAAAGREVRIAFDATRPGNEEAARVALLLAGARRLLTPPRCKDWNTALRKRGACGASRCFRSFPAAPAPRAKPNSPFRRRSTARCGRRPRPCASGSRAVSTFAGSTSAASGPRWSRRTAGCSSKVRARPPTSCSIASRRSRV
jgi:hypothetical protein